jgi:DEAD/DEAH box helicase domain-containing protein
MPSREVVLDIETQNTFQDIGSNDHSKLRVSLVGVYFYETDTYEYFLEADLPKLWPRLEQCDRVIGYNTKGFDNLVLASYYSGDLGSIPQLDLLEEIAKVLGFRVKLDDVAKATIGTGKTGHGLQAVEFWRQGKIQELADYCLMDVKVTKLVYEYARLHGLVKCEDRSGRLMEIPLTIAAPPRAKPAMNLSLGL